MRLIVFDGNSILNRAFYGIKPLTTASGVYTNAVFGFVNIVNKHLTSDTYDYAAVAFDMRAPTFRHRMYDGYKSDRRKMPEELAQQLPYAKRFVSLFGLECVECEGYEADDILGTLARDAVVAGGEAVIVTGDRDSYQLVGDHTTVILAASNEDRVYTPERISEEYGVSPRSLIDVKALMGDRSDCIPGVAGVGEKTALRLICEHGSLDGVYEALDSIGGALHDKLATGKDQAYLSRRLAEIVTDVPNCPRAADCRIKPRDEGGLFELFTELEFTKFIERFALSKPLAERTAEYKYAGISEALELASRGEVFASLAPDTGMLHVSNGEVNLEVPFPESVPLFSDPGYKVTVWSFKELAHKLDELAGARFVSLGDDVSLMGYLAYPNEGGATSASLAAVCLGETLTDEASALGRLRDRLLGILEDTGCYRLYSELEKPLANVLFEMEKAGFSVDTKGLERYSLELGAAADKLSEAVYALAGERFNINSPKQLGVVLFEKLGLKSGKKTKTGYSTDADVLEKLRYDYPVVELVLQYRALAKLKSTYADGLRDCVSDRDGRIHTTFRQTLTLTGRLSSVEPNLQNIPVRTELGRELRRFFLAREGCVLIDCDYSQIELRVLADISGDETMKSAFENGEDIHTATASQVFGVAPEDVTAEMRKRAKAVNFGIVYGISDFSLSRDLGITRREAARYIDSYFSHYPAVREYLENAVATARELGYVVTKFGRRRAIPELNSPKKPVQGFGERVARNTPIQGTAADIIKFAMLDVSKALEESGTGARLILQVHDELIVECPVEHADAVKALITDKMENCCRLSVPLQVDAGIGATWYDSKE